MGHLLSTRDARKDEPQFENIRLEEFLSTQYHDIFWSDIGLSLNGGGGRMLIAHEYSVLIVSTATHIYR